MDRGHFLDIAESQDAHVCESKHAARGGRKGERRPVRSQAPPLLRQRKPYLTGSPPSRRERRCRQECRVSPSIARDRGDVRTSVSLRFGFGQASKSKPGRLKAQACGTGSKQVKILVADAR